MRPQSTNPLHDSEGTEYKQGNPQASLARAFASVMMSMVLVAVG